MDGGVPADDEVTSLTARGGAPGGPGWPVAFTTTHWSVVLTAQDESPAAHEALENLCRTYWRPIFVFLRRQGISQEEAEDITQGFFASLLEHRNLNAGLLSVRPVQAGYTVTLRQVGPDVVATGSGAIDLHGLTFSGGSGLGAYYIGHTIGPTSFGGFPLSSSVITVSSGNFARIATTGTYEFGLSVPQGYVSGTALSGSATYSARVL